MFNNIFTFWGKRLKTKKLMDFCNIYSSKFLSVNSKISSSLLFFVESLHFIKLKKIVILNTKRYISLSTFLLKFILLAFISSAACLLFI